MKAVVAAFNQEKALVWAFSVIMNLGVDLRLKLYLAAPEEPLVGDEGGVGRGAAAEHRRVALAQHRGLAAQTHGRRELHKHPEGIKLLNKFLCVQEALCIVLLC